MVQEALGEFLSIDLRNNGQKADDVLNLNCGADFVYRGQKPPKGVDAKADQGVSIASFDGDADRVVYHYFDEDGGWHLLDGDKLTCLYVLTCTQLAARSSREHALVIASKMT